MSRYTANIITKSPATPTGPTTTGRAPGIWRMDDVAYWTKQGLWPNANIQAPDQYFPYVSLLLSTTSLGNANNNLFVDSSGAFNPVSRNGNTTQGSFTPYATNWSNYFDGSGDYFTLPYTAANFDWFTSGTDFTIEYWFFANSSTGISYSDAGINHSTVVGNRSATSTTDYWSFGPTSAGTVTFYYYNGGGNGVTSTATYSLNTWNHVAMTKTSSGITIFVNGVAGTTTAISGSPSTNNGTGLTIGQGNNSSFNGYISNLRIVRGTAIYSGNFTVPTAPLTAVTNTTLLTCQSNRFRDASTNNLTLTVTGNTSVTEFSPFSPAYPGITYNQSDIQYWSGYFDGTGDYLNVASNAAFGFGTGDYTVEAWVYPTSIPARENLIYVTDTTGGMTLFYNQTQVSIGRRATATDLTATYTVATGAWTHLAVSRESGTTRMYANGVQIASTTTSYNYPTGQAGVGDYPTIGNLGVIGYLSNVRVVKGTAVYTSAFTPPTTPLTAITNTSLLTCQSAAFTDNSTNNFAVTINGNTTVTGNSPFNTVGYWSNYFDGSGDYLTVPSNAALAFGTGDFTIEFWTYRISGANTDNFIISSASNGGFFFGTKSNGWGYGSTGNFWSYNTGVIPTLNTWQHVAISRSGTSIRIFVNGSQIGTTQTDSSDWSLATGGTTIGSQGSSYYYNGYLSNIRVLKGTALYTANFTPPTAPLTAIANTSLLTCQNGSFKDNSTNNFTLTRTGDVSVQSFDPFYTATIASNGGSMYFDGSGDFLNTATNFPPIGTGDFTAECWWYPVGTASQEFTYFSVGDVTSTSGFALATDPARGLFLYSAGYANTSGVAMPVANAWNHIVFTRQSGSLRLYLNGSLRETVSWTNSINAAQVYVGRAANGYFGTPLGYMSNIRYSGTSLYSGSTYTVPTAPLTPSANTGLLLNGMNAGIYDATAINDMETVGNVQVSTVQSKFGGSSVYFDGSGDAVYASSNPALALGSGNFTVECWFYANATMNYGTMWTTDDGTNSASGIRLVTGPNNNFLTVGVGGSAVLTASSAYSNSTWNHAALVRNGSTITLYLNGTSVGSFSNSTNFSLQTFLLGRYGAAYYWNGYIDDLRITKGIARYTSNFTPPDKTFPTY